MRRRLTAVLLAAALLGAVLAGCSSAGSGSSAPGGSSTGSGTGSAGSGSSGTSSAARTDEITVGIAQDLDESLDPHKAVAAGTKEVMFNVFEGLVKPAPSGDLIPAVAEKYDITEDGSVYTFTLREGITFHNGDAVTAEDVKYSLERVAAADEPGVVQVGALSVIESIETPDERTVVLRLSAPSNDLLAYLTAAVIPADYTEQDTQPVGTGPFRYVSRAAQDSLVLERYDGYWGTPAGVERVTYRIIENPDSIMMSLSSGAIDVFPHLTSLQASQLGEDFYVEEGAMNLVQALYLNNAEKPFDSLEVRQAMCYAVDRQAVLDLAFDGYGSLIGSSMYPAFSKYFDDGLTDLYPHDVEKAKSLLAEAGYPDGFQMTITVPSNYDPHVQTAEVIAEQLKEAGIQAEIQLVEWATWVSDIYGGRNFQSTVVGLDASALTPRALLERFQSENSKNFINYRNSEYDELFSRAAASYDDAEQVQLYKDMERNLAENAANVYIQDLADLVAVRKGLEGYQFYPLYAVDVSLLHWAD